MKIGEAAQASGLSAKQVRDYEKAGLLAAVARSPSGYRDYAEADVARLRFIRHAREVGFSLEQIAALLALHDDPARCSSAVKRLTATHIQELDARIASLETMRDTLRQWHDACAGDAHAECSILKALQCHGMAGEAGADGG